MTVARQRALALALAAAGGLLIGAAVDRLAPFPTADVLRGSEEAFAEADSLDRDLAAYWLSGAVLFGVALLSPLEVRYVYALTLPVSVAAAEGLRTLWEMEHGRRLTAAALALAQGFLAVQGFVERLLVRYRP